MHGHAMTLSLLETMGTPEGWGRAHGRQVYQTLRARMEARPDILIGKVSLAGITRIDVCFAAETVIALAQRYHCQKGMCLVDLTDEDILDNWEAAAARAGQPLMVWQGRRGRVLGVEPSPGNRQAWHFALARAQTHAREFAAAMPQMSITNASSKFHQLWQQGFLLRRESLAASGGIEFTYYRIG